jgi:hypothetical protein
VQLVEVLGGIRKLSSSSRGHTILGITVLAWANSLGDFVADTAVRTQLTHSRDHAPTLVRATVCACMSARAQRLTKPAATDRAEWAAGRQVLGHPARHHPAPAIAWRMRMPRTTRPSYMQIRDAESAAHRGCACVCVRAWQVAAAGQSSMGVSSTFGSPLLTACLGMRRPCPQSSFIRFLATQRCRLPRGPPGAVHRRPRPLDAGCGGHVRRPLGGYQAECGDRPFVRFLGGSVATSLCSSLGIVHIRHMAYGIPRATRDVQRYVFVAVSLCSSLIIIPCWRFCIPRWYSYYLWLLYAVYMTFAILLAIRVL